MRILCKIGLFLDGQPYAPGACAEVGDSQTIDLIGRGVANVLPMPAADPLVAPVVTSTPTPSEPTTATLTDRPQQGEQTTTSGDTDASTNITRPYLKGSR